MPGKIFLSDRVVLSAILINSMIIFLLSFKQFSSNVVLQSIDHSLTIFFIIEVIVKLRYFGVKGYFSDSWNIFDFTIVLLSSITLLTLFMHSGDLTFLLVLRLARVLRFVRMLRFVPGIDHLVSGTVRASKSSLFVVVCLLVYIYILAVISCSLFGNIAPEYFDNPLLSLYSTFKLFTIEGWYEIPDLVAQRTSLLWGSLTRIYFIIVIFTGGVMGMSLVNAVFVDEMTMDNTESLERQVDRLERKLDALLQYKGIDIPKSARAKDEASNAENT